MSDLLTVPRAELVKLIYDLIDENQVLKIKITELQEKLVEIPRTNTMPSSQSLRGRKGNSVEKFSNYCWIMDGAVIC